MSKKRKRCQSITEFADSMEREVHPLWTPGLSYELPGIPGHEVWLPDWPTQNYTRSLLSSCTVYPHRVRMIPAMDLLHHVYEYVIAHTVDGTAGFNLDMYLRPVAKKLGIKKGNSAYGVALGVLTAVSLMSNDVERYAKTSQGDRLYPTDSSYANHLTTMLLHIAPDLVWTDNATSTREKSVGMAWAR